MSRLIKDLATIDKAVDFLKNSGKSTTILVKQTRNLGDTLHLTPIIHHYRTTYPDAAIAFIVGDKYKNAHRFNPHIDRLFLVDGNSDPQARFRFWHKIKSQKKITHKIIASIHPFGVKFKQNMWCHANIADQYIANSGIKKMQCERKLIVKTTKEDRDWAARFIKKNRLDARRTVAIEYNSYSAPVPWALVRFEKLVKLLSKRGVKCISIAGKKEGTIRGTVDGRGLTWRQTVALINRLHGMVGVGSGITMLAAACKANPKIYEINIPDSISMKGCKYANSIPILRATQDSVLKVIMSSISS